MTKFLYLIILIIMISMMSSTSAFAVENSRSCYIVIDARDLQKGDEEVKIYIIDTTKLDIAGISKLNTLVDGDIIDEATTETIIQTASDSTLKTKHLLLTANDKIRVIIFYPQKFKNPISIKYTETYRELQIVQDLKSLIASTSIKRLAPGYLVKVDTYILQQERADLNIEISLNSASDTSKAAQNEKRVIKKISVLTGGEEHWFLSADMNIGTATQLKYDPTTTSLQLKDYPNSFYLGINYKVTDLYDNSNGLFYKIMLRPSDRQDSFGFGLGLREGKISIPGLFEWDLSTVSPFIAVIWTKDDSIQNGVNIDKSFGSPSFGYGLSFNIDKLAAWLNSQKR